LQVAYNAINEAAAVLHSGGFFYVRFICRIGRNIRSPDRQECIYRIELGNCTKLGMIDRLEVNG
jgi:hypothetical protein